MNEPAGIRPPRTAFDRHMLDVARTDAPRVFAIVEEWGDQHAARVAGFGLAYEDRAEVNSVEGDFHLASQSPEHARTLFEISSRSAGVRRAHVVWLDGTRSTQPDRGGLEGRNEGAKR